MQEGRTITSERLNELVAEARMNRAVDNLYEAVHARSPVSFTPSDNDLWSSVTDGAGTTIGVAETVRASEALAHELLHAELKLAGHRPYRGDCSSHFSCLPEPQRAVLRQLLRALSNELQHHRMLDRFTALGFSPKYFYSDADKNAYKVVRRTVESLKKNAPSEHFLFPFLTVVAKGGQGDEKARVQLRNFIQIKAATATWTALEAIERTIDEWSSSSDLEAGPTIVEILKHLGGYDQTWVGRSMDFPADGLFVGSNFTIEDINAYLQTKR